MFPSELLILLQEQHLLYLCFICQVKMKKQFARIAVIKCLSPLINWTNL